MLDGQAYVMRLTLVALAELEAEMECDSIMGMVERFESGKFTASDLIALLKAGLRGGGVDPMPELNVDGGPVVAAKTAARLLAVTFAVLE